MSHPKSKSYHLQVKFDPIITWIALQDLHPNRLLVEFTYINGSPSNIHKPMHPNVDFKSSGKKDKRCFLHYGTITYDTITFLFLYLVDGPTYKCQEKKVSKMQSREYQRHTYLETLSKRRSISVAHRVKAWFQKLYLGFLMSSIKVMRRPQGCGRFTISRSSNTRVICSLIASCSLSAKRYKRTQLK